MNAPLHFLELTPKTWEEAKLIGSLISGYNLFRGQGNSNWSLETTLIRAALLNPSAWEASDAEQIILRLFRSRAHQYIQSPPADKDYIEWFSLIQDHGGPSRLLDFSESFYVASFFALESTNEIGCVWAINELRLFAALFWSKTAKQKRIFDRAKLNHNKKYIGEPEEITRFAESFVIDPTNSEDFVLKVIPPRLNERLAVQKGVFLFPCNLNVGFENNLCSTFDFPFKNLNSENAVQLNYKEFLKVNNKTNRKNKQGNYLITDLVPVIKIDLPREFRKDALNDLYNMNIDYASLFPGLDGFTKSLNYHLGGLGYGVGAIVVGKDKEESQGVG